MENAELLFQQPTQAEAEAEQRHRDVLIAILVGAASGFLVGAGLVITLWALAG